MQIEKAIDYYSQCHVWFKYLLGIKNNYSLHYGFYDRKNLKYNDAVKNMNCALTKIAHINQSDNVLDIGCGVGGSAVYFARERGANVIGIDINKIHIQMANKIAKENNVNSLTRFLVMDMMNLGFRNNYFDVILCLESSGYAKERKVLFSNIYKMLKENGRVIVADIFPKKGFLDKDNLDFDAEEIIEKEQFQSLLEEIGYRNINSKDITTNIIPSSRRLYVMSIFANPIEKLLKYIGVRTDMLSLSITGAYNRHISLKKKLWSYFIFYSEK